MFKSAAISLTLLVSLPFQAVSQSNELGTSSTPSTRPRSRPDLLTSPRPVAADSAYRSFNSNLFCSPPPTRAQCPTYSEMFRGGAINTSVTQATNANGRPCFVRHDSLKNPQFPDYAYDRYSVYSTSDPNVFEADVPIMFDYSKLSGPNKKQQYLDFVKRAQACLDNGKPLLSDGSKTLKVKIVPISATELKNTDENLHNEMTWENNYVNLHSQYERADDANYGLKASCEVISHEILHLLGLHDEYHETETTYRPDKQLLEQELGINIPQSVYDSGLLDQNTFDCRDVAPAHNLMNDPDAFSTSRTRVIQCKLSKVTGSVQENLSLVAGRTCPAVYDQQYTIGVFQNMEEVNVFHQMASEVIASENRRTRDILYYHPITNSGLPTALRRGQISQILRPNCMSRPEIRTYLSSAQNAYRNRYSNNNGTGQCR